MILQIFFTKMAITQARKVQIAKFWCLKSSTNIWLSCGNIYSISKINKIEIEGKKVSKPAKNAQFLHHWLRAVRAAARKENLRQQKENRNHLLAYMRDVRRRQRGGASRSLQQSSIRAYVTRRNRSGTGLPIIGGTNRIESKSRSCRCATDVVVTNQEDN